MGSAERWPYDVLIVSPNSAVDSYYIFSDLRLGAVNRALRVIHTAGGKGNNMARALASLGGRAMSLGVVGGYAGQFIAGELDREGIAHDLVWVDVETRHCNTLLVEGCQETTVVLEPGLPAADGVPGELAARVLRHAQEAPFLALMGSLPASFPADYYAKLIHQLEDIPVQVCVDCSGEALRLAAEAGPALVKVNRAELCEAFGLEPATADWPDFQAVAARLPVELLIVTDGPRGAYVFPKGGPALHALTPVQTWVSTAGAGDTFLAGLLLAQGSGKNLSEAIRFASAAASANLQQVVCGFLLPKDVERFLGATSVTQLGAV